MVWQVDLEVPADRAAAVTELALADALSVSEFETAERGRLALSAVYAVPPDLAQVTAALRDLLPDAADPILHELPETDWVGHSNRIRSPFRIGDFLLHGSDHRASRPAARWPLEIEAAQAFGTGRAPSTALCLRVIGRIAAGGRGKGARLLDLGCGSGVLAIAAARAWPAQGVAADIDPVAVRIAAENAALNGVAGRLRCCLATGPASRTVRALAPYDAIFANILSGPLIAMARDMRALTHPGTLIVLSGLLVGEARRVAAAYRLQGFVLRHHLREEGWSALVLSRQGPALLPPDGGAGGSA